MFHLVVTRRQFSARQNSGFAMHLIVACRFVASLARKIPQVNIIYNYFEYKKSKDTNIVFFRVNFLLQSVSVTES